MKEIQTFLQEHYKKVKPVYKKLTLSYWNATTTGKPEFYKEYEEVQIEIEKIYNNKEDFEKVKKFYNEEIKDKLLKRQIKIIYNSYLSSQGDINLLTEIIKISTKIEERFNGFRAMINDKEYSDNGIKDILKSEKDSEKLKQAWEASKKQGEVVEKELLELIRLRNRLAKENGFKNYHERNLILSEQNPEQIDEIFEKVDALTRGSFEKIKKDMDEFLKKKLNVNKLLPWHYQDLFFQEGPEIYHLDLDRYYEKNVLKNAIDFYDSINLPVNDILEKSDLYEKPGKYQHAYCIDIDKEGDTRVLMNLKDNEKWMDTTLHELGHAVYDKCISHNLPFVLIDSAHTFVTEAIALLFGRLSKNKYFLKRYCNINKEDLMKIDEDSRKSLRLRQLVFSRWTLVMVNFERQLYENPEQDLNKLWWDLVKRYQLIDFSRDKPDWASKIHLVSSPVYYHNYMLGEMLASQLIHYISKNIVKTEGYEIDFCGKKEIGDYLKEKIFVHGRFYGWDELIRNATGEDLNPDYFAEQFC